MNLATIRSVYVARVTCFRPNIDRFPPVMNYFPPQKKKEIFTESRACLSHLSKGITVVSDCKGGMSGKIGKVNNHPNKMFRYPR